MTIKQLCRDDLINRNTGYTFTETVIESFTLVEFKNASDVVVRSSTKMGLDEAYLAIREALVGPLTILACLTTTQRNNLTGVKDGQPIFNITTKVQDTYDGTVWVASGATGGAFTEAFEDAGTRAIAGWGVIAAPTAHVNKLVTIIIHNANNATKTVGVRKVGSSLERKFPVAKDSALSMVVLTDASGDFEICSDASLDVSFTIAGVVG